MTVVVAAKVPAEGKVVMAADSACSVNSRIERCMDPKIEMIGKVGFGVSGEVKQESILRGLLTRFLAGKKRDVAGYISNQLSLDLWTTFKDAGLDSSVDWGQYILATEGRIFYVQSDLSIWEPLQGWAAVGSAGDSAFAVLSYVALDNEQAGVTLNVPETELMLHRVLESLYTCDSSITGPTTTLII